VTVFGAVAVSAMVVAYALEGRHRIFVGLFAAACAASSAYGFLIGSIPFGLVEAVWGLVALQRLRRREPRGGAEFLPSE
jgi:hypothetical protein